MLEQHQHRVDVPSGLAIVQSNLPEQLRDLLALHLRRQPLAPLESERVLIQSNGIGRWLQLALARDPIDGGLGISASMEFDLPARFFWEMYGVVLGEEALPAESPFDADRLRWLLFRLLPELSGEPVFEPLRDYLGRDESIDSGRRCWQLAGELGNLFEQYQLYRADWLTEWMDSRDVVSNASGRESPLDDRDRWQPALWRRILAAVSPDQRTFSRAHLHRSFVARLEQADAAGEDLPELPRRVVVFGISSLPSQMIDALAALARHVQVLICLQNPCQHYWADIVEGRDLLRADSVGRNPKRVGWPDVMDDDAVDRLANPLLAVWGRQGRDFFALLDEKDQPEQYKNWFDRINLFEDYATESRGGLLHQIQQGILDLESRVENPVNRRLVDPREDSSVCFHAAHSRHREVEILHDQLLDALESDEQLHPRDIIVMVPDVDAYAPHIEAVFGAFTGSAAAGDSRDRRAIPFHIADRRERLVSPALEAFAGLLDLPELRLTASQVIDLLNVPAIRRRFGIENDDADTLTAWLGDAGVRWGLDAEHRVELGLERGFDEFSWRFGIRRMMLGHAVGDSEEFDGILPFEEVAGSEADLAGRLACLIERLDWHLRSLQGIRTAQEWAKRLRTMIDDLMDLCGETDGLAGYRLDQAVDAFVESAEAAGPGAVMPLDVVRDAVLERLDEEQVSQRFLGGRVNFSTLMPMRAIPFRMVCLLGMNDGEYPRTRKPADFDLMGRSGFFRPGDRSRREDDRYLFLEAVLAARERLYVSWIGRSIRNDEPQPPSVLVGQLRDQIAAGWTHAAPPDEELDGGQSLLDGLTVEHPLQPFSPEYFKGEDGDARLFTYAAEWRAALNPCAVDPAQDRAPLEPVEEESRVPVRSLENFLKQPLEFFTSERFEARLKRDSGMLADSESFSLDGLESWQINNDLLQTVVQDGDTTGRTEALERAGRRLQLSGRLPRGAQGELVFAKAMEKVQNILEHRDRALEGWPGRSTPEPVRFETQGVDGRIMLVEDWLAELPCREHEGAIEYARIETTVTGMGRASPRFEKLVQFWPMHLLVNASGLRLHTLVIHETGCISLRPVAASPAARCLEQLLSYREKGLCRPLPVASATSVAFLREWIKQSPIDGQEDEARRNEATKSAMNKARAAFEDGFQGPGECSKSPAVARWYPDFEALTAENQGDDFVTWSDRLYGPLMRHWATPDDDKPEADDGE